MGRPNRTSGANVSRKGQPATRTQHAEAHALPACDKRCCWGKCATGAAARRLALSTLGFLQYLGPSLQLVIAVLVFGEAFRTAQQVGFGCIWAALALVSLDTVLRPGTRPGTLSGLDCLVQAGARG